MAINPSAKERQRRSATRRSCTGSASNPAAARSHSTSTRSIHARKPSLGLGVFARVIFETANDVATVPTKKPSANLIEPQESVATATCPAVDRRAQLGHARTVYRK